MKFSKKAERMRKSKEEATETVEKMIQIPREVLEAMEDLADITGVPGQIGTLIQDALRKYELLIYHESEGHKVLIDTGDGNPVIFDHLIKQGAEEKAKRYFASVTESE